MERSREAALRDAELRDAAAFTNKLLDEAERGGS